MADLGIKQVNNPDVFRLKTSSSRHVAGLDEAPEDKSGSDFSSLLTKSLSEVNQLQNNYSGLIQQSLVSPDSVNAHDITIAGAEANMALNITKNVLERVISAYKEIVSLR